MTKQEVITKLRVIHDALRKNHKLHFEQFEGFDGVSVYATQHGYAFSFKFKDVEFDYFESRNELQINFGDYDTYLAFDPEKWIAEISKKIKKATKITY